MRVCHFICSTGLGRGEFYVDLANEMSKALQVYLLIPKNAKYLDRISKNIKVIEYKSHDKRENIFLYFELYQIIKKYNFDIIHTHFSKASQIFYLLNFILKKTHIATKHNSRKGAIFNKIKNVVAVSKGVRDTILKENVKIIHNGISPLNIKKTNEKNNKFSILAVGRLDKIKGFDILINELFKLEFDFNLQIIGDGEEKESLEKLIAGKNLAQKVKLLGFRDDIPELMSRSDLVVMSSLSEGFSIVLIEAIFYANVFISTKVSGCDEILSDDLLIKHSDIASKITDIFYNYEKYKHSFNEIKNKYQQKLCLENTTKQYLEFYQICLKD